MTSLVSSREIHDAVAALESAIATKGNVEMQNAARRCRASIDNNSVNDDTLITLAKIAFALGAFDMCEKFLRYGVAVFQHSLNLHCDLGSFLHFQGRTQEALTSYREALSIKPDVVEVHKRIAQIFLMQKDTDHLIECLEEAVKIIPDDSSLLVRLGEARKIKGDTDDSILLFRRALRLDPDNAYIYQTLSHTKKFNSRDEDVREMESLLARRDLQSDQKIRIGFSLGKAYEDIGDYEKSFFYYKQANDEKRSNIEFSIEEEAERFTSATQTFDRDLFQRYQGAGFDSGTPIFVLGMPRSGTTLIEQMLATHPEVHGAGELHVMHDLIRNLWNLPQLKGRTYPQGIEAFPKEILYNAGRQYVQSVRQLAGETSPLRTLDKMPHNFMFIGMIRLILPNARIIHCKRSPEDTCFSLYKHLFTNGHRYSFDLTELAKYYRLYADLMRHWHRVLPGFICDVNYEDLVNDQRGQLERMSTFCDLPWHEECLQFYKSENKAITASSMQVIQPIYSSAVNYWRRYEKFLQPLLDELHAA